MNPTRRWTVPAALLLGLAGCYGSSVAYVPYEGKVDATPDRRPEERVAFRHHGTNPREDTRDATTSTFGIDVDDASFTYAREELAAGRLPEPEMVRVEEFVNHLEYRYALPGDGRLALLAEAAPSPFTRGAHIVSFALQAGETPASRMGPRHIVFALDTSGSMAEESRMSLVKYGVLHLVDCLRSRDTVAIVGFDERPHLLLAETPASQRDAIWSTVRGIVPRGSTDAAAGLAEAYRLAGRGQAPGGLARVILISDGLTNREGGWSAADVPYARIREEARGGVRLTVVGVGQQTYNDSHLERLSREGQGRYTHVGDQADIERAFGFASLRAMEVVAEDVRVQVEFDPAVVRSWRLLGYESRYLPDRDFESRFVRAPHLEAGKAVTALYELRLQDGAQGALGSFSVAYRDPETGESVRAATPAPSLDAIPARFEAASPQLRLAACTAELAELLRGSVYVRDHGYGPVLQQLDALHFATAWEPNQVWSGFDEVRQMSDKANELQTWRYSPCVPASSPYLPPLR